MKCVNRMAAGSSHGVFLLSPTFQTCFVQLRVLGLMAYWYTGSAFHQIPQSYLNILIYLNELLIPHRGKLWQGKTSANLVICYKFAKDLYLTLKNP